METLKKVHNLVIKKYNELENYTKVYNVKAKLQREKLLEESKLKFKEDPNSVDLDKIAKELFYMNGFHHADIRQLQTSLLESYGMYKDLDGEEEFPAELNTAISLLKTSFPKLIFTIDGENFVEIVEGRLEILLKEYEEKNYFKIFEKQLVNLFNE
jgi:hypothetical protein